MRLPLLRWITITGWWFGFFFIFPYIGNNHPNWLSYFSEGWPNHQPDKNLNQQELALKAHCEGILQRLIAANEFWRWPPDIFRISQDQSWSTEVKLRCQWPSMAQGLCAPGHSKKLNAELLLDVKFSHPENQFSKQRIQTSHSSGCHVYAWSTRFQHG